MLASWLKNAKKVAIAGHMRPDGDCMGSCLGLFNYLRENYKNLEVDVFLEKPRSCFDVFPGREVIRGAANSKVYDVFFALDAGDKGRLGFAGDVFDRAKKTVCIDHHVSNTGFADENFIDPMASSASEMVYRLIEDQDISKNVATCLYLGIVHDTGVFLYSSTSPETMRVAARLMETGINAQELVDKTFYERSFEESKALGLALEKAYIKEGFIVSVITNDDLKKIGANDDDLESIVSNLRMTRGTFGAVFAHQKKDGTYKVSLRSGDEVDVSAVAVKFGGGGHKKASGLTIKDAKASLDRLLEVLASEVHSD